MGSTAVGLVLYGSYAWTQCPLTLDYGVLERELDLARIAENSAKSQRTAIGSAVGLAVSRLRKSEAESKVIILLTDGQNNSGELGPTTAAQLAKEYGIRIYTIGVGSRDGSMGTPGGLFGWMTRSAAPVDEEALKEIAAIADGKYYRATDTASLAGAYAEISQLEATEIEIGDYYEHEEGFVPYAIMGALFLLASVFSRRYGLNRFLREQGMEFGFAFPIRYVHVWLGLTALVLALLVLALLATERRRRERVERFVEANLRDRLTAGRSVVSRRPLFWFTVVGSFFLALTFAQPDGAGRGRKWTG